ncbi:ribosomal protein S5 domain 2-like protein [Pholiota conissans]|uniref:Ribosomal protein S5 domain 2-like protein n=1 Tax=Pholiota conissans TaxID=109636 RepID=A0A9P5YQT3_9AGAR|nr:ribosomal protein S5 domain 2-like protein [Pholiota conissans]
MTTSTRHDGRKHHELRPITIFYDGLARVDGSARFGFGESTAALASVSGPIEVRLASELPSKATFEVLVRPLANVPATESKLLASMIKATLEPSLILTKNPRTLVQLVVQALSSPSNATWKDTHIAAMANASTLAFLQACSVPMQGVVTAVAIGRLVDGSLIVDPSEDEMSSLQAGGCFVFMFSGSSTGSSVSNIDCVWSSWKSTSGRYSQEELFKAKELAKVGAQAVYEEVRRSLEKRSGATAIPMLVVQEKEAVKEEGTLSSDEKMEI